MTPKMIKNWQIFWLLGWLGIVTCASLVVYISFRQALRSEANKPQTEQALVIAQAAARGERWVFAGDKQIDLAESQEVFHLIFNERGEVASGNGFLYGRLPQLPKGIFNHVSIESAHKLTWQPEARLRFAMVFRQINGPTQGFVAVGRSLSATQERINSLGRQVAAGWLVMSGLTGFLYLVARKKIKA